MLANADPNLVNAIQAATRESTTHACLIGIVIGLLAGCIVGPMLMNLIERNKNG